MSSPKPPIWGTHIRWMKLCSEAWRIIIDGRYPFQEYSTPTIVGEYCRKQHDELLHIVEDWFNSNHCTLAFKAGDKAKQAFTIYIAEEWREIIVKPDGYALFHPSSNAGPINLVIETTTRHPNLIPEEWLTAYAISYYIRNLRPTFVLVVSPKQIWIQPLNTESMEKLKYLLEHPPSTRPTSWLCSNCDLLPVCPEPLA